MIFLTKLLELIVHIVYLPVQLVFKLLHIEPTGNITSTKYSDHSDHLGDN